LQYLKAQPVTGKKRFFNKGVSRCHELLQIEFENDTDFVIAVKTYAVTVADQHQKEIQKHLIGSHGGQIAIMQQAMVKPTERTGDFADAMWVNRRSGNHISS